VRFAAELRVRQVIFAGNARARWLPGTQSNSRKALARAEDATQDIRQPDARICELQSALKELTSLVDATYVIRGEFRKSAQLSAATTVAAKRSVGSSNPDVALRSTPVVNLFETCRPRSKGFGNSRSFPSQGRFDQLEIQVR
jgi:hypothetical protein